LQSAIVGSTLAVSKMLAAARLTPATMTVRIRLQDEGFVMATS
jgi:hypothetical protein